MSAPEFDFEAALNAQVASQSELEPETAVDEETPTEDPAPGTEPETAEPETPEPASPEYPEDVARLLDKYDGDITKALKAAVEAQSTIGSLGNELGQLRKAVEQLEKPETAPSPAAPFLPQGVAEAIEANPSQVATWALQNDNKMAFEAAMTEWYDQDPREAGRFERTLERELLKQELTQQIQPEIESVRSQQQARQVADAHRELSQAYPDFTATLESATQDEVSGIDPNALQALQQTNPKAALELVYRWVAQGRQVKQQQVSAQRAEEVRQEKREAAVVTADSTTPATVDKTTMEKLMESMLSPEPQSVRHGLTH